MTLTDCDNIFKILSVIELRLPAQDAIIPPRPHSVLSFRIQGNADIQYQNRHLPMNTNDILFIPAGKSYYIHSGQETLLCINLSISQQADMEPEHFVPPNVHIFKEAFQSIYDTWCLKKPGYYHKSMSILYAILSQLEKQFSQAYHSPAFQSIKHTVNYMHANFTDPELSISSLCRIANLSDTQFRRNFYIVYGTTPLKYLQSLRIDYAADLLSGSSLTVEEISSMCGFTDSKYFCSVFKKYKLQPPSAFRKSL